ncbi:MAG: RsmB/NOP family class I SAM-dependent RNA methyltransferase [Lachnospiraceae bacterium]|nr:RsmB/NOP family class I SAM-dependent RNA methyltransferase [Lachnospiraceae bacterium]
MIELPETFRNDMKDLLGEEYPAFLESYNASCPPTFMAGCKDDDPAPVLEALSDCGLLPEDFFEKEEAGCVRDAYRVPWNSFGFYYDPAAAPGKHVLHEAGFYYIQEASAMAPVSFLEPRPGERILDLCAAPGGKTTDIGLAMKGKGLLVSNEIHPKRARILSENVERMGLTGCVVTNATPGELSRRFPFFFDRILVDAPCSGEGMFRKHPEAIDEWSREQVAVCAKRQTEILEDAHICLRPGGRLVYSTCTFSREENEDMILSFLERHPEYSLHPMPLSGGMIPGFSERAGSETEASMIRLLPHRLSGEGHFVAVLEKSGPAAFSDQHVRSGKQKGAGKIPAELTAFLSESLPSFAENVREELLFYMGSQIYLLPEPLSQLDGLKLVRPGLHLGSVEKNRFAPSLALARALSVSVNDKFNYVNLSTGNGDDRKLAAAYLEGGTFPYDGEKGWYLIALNGRGLGWGKLAGGIMKNHYPKGLRKKVPC